MQSVALSDASWNFKTLRQMATAQALNPYKNATAVTAIEIELVMRQGKYSENA